MSKMTCSDEYGMLNMCKKYTTHSKYVQSIQLTTHSNVPHITGNDAHWAEPLIKLSV